MAYVELSGDKQAADAVFYQVTIGLRREVSARIPQPVQDLQAVTIRECAKDGVLVHGFSIQNGSCAFS